MPNGHHTTRLPPNRPQSVHEEHGHTPHTLLITCSDCRAEPASFSQSHPQQLFVIRNSGNLAPIFGTDANTAASVEYALNVLQVSRILVVGHTHCEAIRHAVTTIPTKELSSLQMWLVHTHKTKAAFTSVHGHTVNAIEHNALCQLENLKTHPSVAQALKTRALSLEARIYDSQTGTFRTLLSAKLNPATPQMSPLSAHLLPPNSFIAKDTAHLAQPCTIANSNLDRTVGISGSRLSEAVIVRNPDKVFICLFDVHSPPLFDPFLKDSAQHLRKSHQQGHSLRGALSSMPMSARAQHALRAQTLGFVGCDLGSDRIIDVYCTDGSNAFLIRNGAIIESAIGESASSQRGGFEAGTARWLLRPTDRVLLFTRPLNQWTGLKHILALVTQDDPELAASSLQEILTMLSGKEQLFTLLTFGEPQSVIHQPADASKLLEPLEIAIDSLIPESKPTQPCITADELASIRAPQAPTFPKSLWPAPDTDRLVNEQPNHSDEQTSLSAIEALRERPDEPSQVEICLPEDLSAYTTDAIILSPLIKELPQSLPEFEAPSLHPWDQLSPPQAPTRSHQMVTQSVHLLSQGRYSFVWLFLAFAVGLITIGLFWFSQG